MRRGAARFYLGCAIAIACSRCGRVTGNRRSPDGGVADSSSGDAAATDSAAEPDASLDAPPEPDASNDGAADGEPPDGSCGPAPRWALCNGACVDLYTDTHNCGRCGYACLSDSPVPAQCRYDPIADAGTCVCGFGALECSGGCPLGPPGAPATGWICTITDYDPDYCGGCNTKCPAGARCCVKGVCSDVHDASFPTFCGYLEYCP